jgi:O-antigen/teichoic acid export membrane protein
MTRLASATRAGGLWLTTQKIAQQVANLLQVVIVARFLSPADFGLMGIVLLSIRFGEVLTYTGFEFALIQKQNVDKSDLDTTWLTLLARRVFLAVALITLAAPIASFFNEPAAAMPLRAVALAQLVKGLTSLSPTLLQKELQFKRQVVMMLAGLAAGSVAAIIAAFLLRNVWALVIGLLVQISTIAVLSYALHPYRPGLQFNWQRSKELFNYGQWMLASAVLYFLTSQGADTFSGLLFGAAALGIYQMSSRFAMLPSNYFGDIILNAVLPSYAKLQHDLPRLTAAFLRVLSFTTFVILPVTILIAVILPVFIVDLLGDQWHDTIPLIPVIAAAGLLQAFLRTGSPLFLGTGRPKLQFSMDLISASVLLVAALLLGRAFGVLGLAWAAVLAALSPLPFWFVAIHRLVRCSARQLLAAVLPALGGATAMMVILLLVRAALVGFDAFVVRAIVALAGTLLAAAVYLGIVTLISKSLGHHNPVREATDLVLHPRPRFGKVI